MTSLNLGTGLNGTSLILHWGSHSHISSNAGYQLARQEEKPPSTSKPVTNEGAQASTSAVQAVTHLSDIQMCHFNHEAKKWLPVQLALASS